MNTEWSANNPVWARHCELIDAVAREALAFDSLRRRQRKLVESYTERRRYPKRTNRLPALHEEGEIT